MNGDKVRLFMELAGQTLPKQYDAGDEKRRLLGAQLLLSEVLEYVVHGLGVVPEFRGTKISEPDQLTYQVESESDKVEALDGLADVAYTMYWNAHAFGLPLEEGFDVVCDNNLEKFVRLQGWTRGVGTLPQNEWHCNCETRWPAEVAHVEVISVGKDFFAVGKDRNGKVRKPSHYQTVELSHLFDS